MLAAGQPTLATAAASSGCSHPGCFSPWLCEPQGFTLVDSMSVATEAFGQRVRELRASQGHSQERFAHLCGIDRSYMGQIERGHKNPTLRTILRIAKTLSVDPSELVQGLREE